MLSSLPFQVSKRYYNSHAFVDLTVSAVFDPPLMDGKCAGGKPPRVLDPVVIISVPTVISKSPGDRSLMPAQAHSKKHFLRPSILCTSTGVQTRQKKVQKYRFKSMLMHVEQTITKVK